MNTRSRLGATLLLALLLPSISACGGEQAPVRDASVWIDVPVDNLVFPDLHQIQIEGHAASPNGIGQVEIRINGETWTTLDTLPADGSLSRFETSWTPAALGDYTIEVVALAADGSTSSPDRARVRFGEAPTPVEPTTPEAVTEVSPETASPETVVQFWADPAEIEAGACTTMYWHAENVEQVVFGGNPQDLDGSYRVCLCANERYSLFVTHLDGTEERLRLDIPVTGECATPTPVDTIAPPAPSPASPGNGSELGCRGSQTMVWSAVSDPSGIAQYQVQVQRHSGDGLWQDAPGSMLTGLGGTSANIGVECGWTYRWRVRAVDGLGNVGDWSGWWLFIITLI